MSSIELLLLPVALMAGTARPPAACPARDGGVPLSDATVYDGPIADNAILAPDSERRVLGGTVDTWPVAYVYAARRQVVLSCRYARRPPVIVTVSRPVRACRYTVRGGTRAMACS